MTVLRVLLPAICLLTSNEASGQSSIIKRSTEVQGTVAEKVAAVAGSGLVGPVLVLRDGVPSGHVRVQIQIIRQLGAASIKAGDLRVRILSKSGQEIPFIAKAKDSDSLGAISNGGNFVSLADFQIQGNGDDVDSVEVRFSGSTRAFKMTGYSAGEAK